MQHREYELVCWGSNRLKILALLALLAISIIVAISIIQSKITEITLSKYENISIDITDQLRSLIAEKQRAMTLISLSFTKGTSLEDDIYNKHIKAEKLNELVNIITEETSLKNIWVQIVSKDGISIFRSWTKNIGNPIYQKRKDIALMLKDQKMRQSISVGMYDLSLKTMIPIYKNNQFLGIFEIMGKFNSIAQAINERNMNLVVLVDKTYKDQLSKPFSNLFVNDYYVANINANKELLGYIKQKTPEFFIDRNDNFFTDEDKNLLCVKYTIFDVNAKPMAYFLVFKRLDQIPLGGLNELRYQIIIFTIFLLSIIFWPLFYFVSKKNKDAIIKINKTLEKRVEKQNIRLKKQNELLHYQVEHDGLTKLPNQTSLINRLKKNNFTTLLIVNLDDFRQLNDFYGTSIGDKVLALVASEFAQIENENITVYRMPSDEFAILIESSVEDYDAEIKSVLDRIKPSLNLKLKSLDQDVLIGLTIGIDSGRGLPLLAHADSALKRAKTSRKHYLFYDESINPSQHYQTNIEWIQKIKLALAENRIVAYYQPIIDNSTKQISKYEALVRLIDVDGTIVPPVKFLEIAKKSKLYHEITKCVLNQIILQFKDKKEEVSINISYNDIVDIATREFIVQTLEAQNGQAKIVFEILENDSIEDFEAVKSFVAEVKSHGAKVAIDDFGSGYSNFEVVFNLNVDYLKIDGTLIKNLDRSLNSKLIVETIVGFCKKLNIACIAEFVHSEEISKKVLDIGINFSQGYYFAQPMSPDDI